MLVSRISATTIEEGGAVSAWLGGEENGEVSVKVERRRPEGLPED